MSALTYVFWGYGSEDVLGPLKAHLEAAGERCLQLPEAEPDPAREVALLRSTPFVLLTSAHFTRDRAILADLYPSIHVGASPLQLIRECRPVASVFYPHDLGTPLVLLEPQVLGSAFDVVLWPTPWFGYGPTPRGFREVGWVGYRAGAAQQPKDGRPRWIFSDFELYRKSLGLERTWEKLAPVLEAGVEIKFPFWPGHEEYEAYFRARGAQVMPATESTFEAILRSPLVLSNGVSGVTFEALSAGVPVLNLLEEHLGPGVQREFLGPLEGCRTVSYAEAPTALTKPPPAPAAQIRPFDFEGAVQAIREACAAKKTG